MKRIQNNLVGIQQGVVLMFSDFQEDGEMWSGVGPRECRKSVRFGESFRHPPAVQASVSLWDVDTKVMMRADLSTDRITRDGFDLVFSTWGDSRFARIRVSWMAIGEASHDDDWELY